MNASPDLTVPAVILAGIFCICGLLSLLAAIFNWDWFFSTAGASLAGGRRARTRARFIYGIAGLLILGAVPLLLITAP